MLRAKKAEWQEQMVIFLILAFNFRLNMGFILKSHAVCALRGLCQLLFQLFTLSPQPSHCCQACAVQVGFHLQVAVLCFERLTLILFIASIGNCLLQTKGQILATVIANRCSCPKNHALLPARHPCVHESLPTGKCPLHPKVKLLTFEICLWPAKHHHCWHHLDGIG